MSLIAQRAAIIAAINTDLPTLKEACQSHGGRFNQKELERIAAKAPTVRVSCLGLSSIEEVQGAVKLTVRWAAFVLATDRRGSSRDAAALAIVTSLAQLIAGTRWGLEDAAPPQQIRADNLYSGQLDRRGVALWAVTWQQALEIEQLDAATLDIFATFAADYDLDPADGETDASDTVTLDP